MAKKIVRGITDVKTITNQDFDTNNVNDLLSDGQYNYIHRKKGKNEEYHNLTDNIKTISSDNTELLSVTNNNKTTNTATLHPKHDKQKEQVLESTRNTITIHHGTNGTDEKTTVDTNPLKVLEHENLISDSEYITLDHQTDVNKTHIKTESLKQELQQLHETKQDVLTAGDGITIQGQTISASAPTLTIYQFPSAESVWYFASKYVMEYALEYGRYVLTTYVFDCVGTTAEGVLNPDLKEDIDPFITLYDTITSGALSIKRDGADIKLLNSAPSRDVIQHATFTFVKFEVNGGGGSGV